MYLFEALIGVTLEAPVCATLRLGLCIIQPLRGCTSYCAEPIACFMSYRCPIGVSPLLHHPTLNTQHSTPYKRYTRHRIWTYFAVPTIFLLIQKSPNTGNINMLRIVIFLCHIILFI